MTSVSTRSGRSRRAAASAAPPSATASTRQFCDSNRARYSRMSALSSAMMMRALAISAGTATALAAVSSVAVSGAAPGSQRSASATNGAAPSAVDASVDLLSTCAGSRCAFPSGMRTVNVVPSPTTLRASTVPPCILTISDTSARPMPDPSWVRDREPGTRRNRSKMCGSSAAGIPVPVSRDL